MANAFDDTIAAIATAVGRAGIGMVRISGRSAKEILSLIFEPYIRAGRRIKQSRDFEPRRMYYGFIRDNTDNVNNGSRDKGAIVDEVMAVYMRAPYSYTREDMVEICCHGGAVAVTRVLALVMENGARPAENGEFTRRAFMNGRIDLSQAEAVMDLVNAQTELAARAAITRLRGGLAEIVKKLAGELLGVIANIEVSIDYPEHESETLTKRLIKEKVIDILMELEKLLSTTETGRILSAGIEAVIVGRPNVGKSSVLNALLGEDRAIVTDIPGTTRDLISESVNLRGVPMRLTDTAGIRNNSADAIEAIGVERSRRSLETADLALLVVDGSAALTQSDRDLYELIKKQKHIVLVNKSDLPAAWSIETSFDSAYRVSALTKNGFEPALEHMRAMFIKGEIEPNTDVLISGARNRNSLKNAVGSLRNVIDGIDSGMSEDLYVIDLKDCYDYLGEITGETLDAELLDKIFSEFCLGK